MSARSHKGKPTPADGSSQHSNSCQAGLCHTPLQPYCTTNCPGWDMGRCLLLPAFNNNTLTLNNTYHHPVTSAGLCKAWLTSNGKKRLAALFCSNRETPKQHSNGKSNTDSASCNLGSRKSQSSCYRVINLSLKEHSWEAAVLQAALQHGHTMHLEMKLARIIAP